LKAGENPVLQQYFMAARRFSDQRATIFPPPKELLQKFFLFVVQFLSFSDGEFLNCSSEKLRWLWDKNKNL